MKPIRDDELLAFALGEGLDAVREDEIRRALADDAALGARLAAVAAGLQRAFAAPEPAPGFEHRVWARLAPSLPERRPPWWRRWLPMPGVGIMPRAAFAGLLAITAFAGYWFGRADAPAPTTGPMVLAEDAAERVLALYLAAHLDATERALLVVANSAAQDDVARDLAADLVASNRLYAAAARRAGRPQLAAFLRQLEPVLADLAAGEDAEALGARIRDDDLTFKTRAAAALARRDLATAPLPTGQRL